MQAQQRKQLIGASVVALGLVGVGAWLGSRPEPVPPPPMPPMPQTPIAEMETVRPVIRETPILSERRDTARPLGFYPAGTLLFTGNEWAEMGWTREGRSHAPAMTIESQFSHGDSVGYAFVDDLGPAIEVTSVATFCGDHATTNRSDSCHDRLMRWRAEDGTLIAWDPCHTGECLVARERNGSIERMDLTALSQIEIVTAPGHTLAVASTHPTQEGGSQEVLTVFDVNASTWAPLFQELIQRTVVEGEVATNLTSQYSFAEDGMHISSRTITQNVNRVEPLSEDRQDRLLPWPTPTGT